MPTRHLLVLFAAAALALAGCGEEDLGDPGDSVEDRQGAPEEIDTPLSVDDGTATDDATTAAGGTTIAVESISFPPSTSVTAGEPVTFDNQDTVAHTVTSGTPDDATSEDAGLFDQDLPAGGEVTITVEEPGTYRYFCEIHQQMTGRLVVEPA